MVTRLVVGSDKTIHLQIKQRCEDVRGGRGLCVVDGISKIDVGFS